jgi:protein-S-isoprenylcysteine O-methyltransferase Ste14
MTVEERDAPRVVVFPPILFGAALAVGFLLNWLWPVHPLPAVGARVLGVLLLVASGVLAVWAERTMHGAGTNVRPDKPTLTIVTTGPFRYSRNPLYIASTGFVMAVTLFFNALWPLVLLVPVLVVVRYGVVGREERYLEAKFGDSYRAYKAQVRRWI